METITLTFGDCGENHVGMEKIGKVAEKGFSLADLKKARKVFKKLGLRSSIEDISFEGNEAYILIVHDAVDFLAGGDIFEEQKALKWDSKAFMYGRVVNKHARHNLCYDEKSQEPNYERKKGRIVAWDDIPCTKGLKENLEDIFSVKLIGEGNRYYDVRKCGIGYHGDTERRIVIGCRLGATMNLRYQWFTQNEPVGDTMEFIFEHGDIYAMSEKAVGFDWKKRSIYTLRHSAGAEKFTKI